MSVRTLIKRIATVGGVVLISYVTAGIVIAASTPALSVAPVASTSVSHTLPRCARLLAAYRTVSHEAGLVIGSAHVAPITATGPNHWAKILRSAGDASLARTAARIHDARSDRAFVVAITASASAALAHVRCK